MPKRISNVLISLIAILFSFFYTNKIINIFKNNDPIYIEIKKYEGTYFDTKENSIITDNDIIPGIKGEKIDRESSYQNMKKAGKFDKNLLVFQESIPTNDLKGNYNKFIVSLNKNQNNVSLVFVIENTDNILSILSILNKKEIKATFFASKEIFDNSVDIIKEIIDYGNQVELLSNTYSIYEVNKYNSLIKIISKERLNFCLNINKNSNLLDSCESSKLYTITSNKVVNTNIYLYLKRNLDNGLIIAVDNSNSIVKELSSSINYVLQKGKKFVLLKSIIE